MVCPNCGGTNIKPAGLYVQCCSEPAAVRYEGNRVISLVRSCGHVWMPKRAKVKATRIGGS